LWISAKATLKAASNDNATAGNSGVLVVITSEVVVCCVVTFETAPVKSKFRVCGIPRWLVSTATVWGAVNWPFNLKLNVSPELQFWGEQAERE